MSLLNFYVSLMEGKATGRFTWEIFLDRSKKRAVIWGSGTICCLWDHGNEITLQLAIISKLFQVMIDVLVLLSLLKTRATISLKRWIFFCSA